jgi:uncharacterized protein YqjF (DUF2071 family)
MPPEPVTAVPPRAVRPALLTQAWREVAFLHWALDPAVAAPLLPPGTRPDLWGDHTFVGLVALRMERTALMGSPPVPWLGTFGQVNVRLYSVDDEGRRGVTFLSLDADRLPPAVAARYAAGLPYVWSRVRVQRSGDRCGYRVDRHRGTARARIDLRLGPPRDPGPLELFVTARWGLHQRVLGRTVYAAVVHPPWTLREADLLDCDAGLLADAGLPVSGPTVSVLFSPGVDDVRIGPPARRSG